MTARQPPQFVVGTGSADPGRPDEERGRVFEALAIELREADATGATAEMTVGKAHTNQVDVVQGGVYTVLADATAGWFTTAALPTDATFTTLEMRTSVLRAARPGSTLVARATPVHVGKRTAVVEVKVWERGTDPARVVASFGCTQLVLDSGRIAEGAGAR